MFPNFDPGPIIPLQIVVESAEENDFDYNEFGVVIGGDGNLFLGIPSEGDWATLVTLQQMLEAAVKLEIEGECNPFLVLFLREGYTEIFWGIVPFEILVRENIPANFDRLGN